jgi:hypothetical protein
MTRITTSARRRLDGPLATDRWRDYRAGTPLDWLKVAICAMSIAGGIILGVWATGGF